MSNIKKVKNMFVDGDALKRFVRLSGFTKEQVVVAVQEEGYRFSLAGLDSLLRGEVIKRHSFEILSVIAKKLSVDLTEFAAELPDEAA